MNMMTTLGVLIAAGVGLALLKRRAGMGPAAVASLIDMACAGTIAVDRTESVLSARPANAKTDCVKANGFFFVT